MIERFGDLHVVVNNAAWHRIRGLVDMTEHKFGDIAAVKLKGTFAVSRWTLRHWRNE